MTIKDFSDLKDLMKDKLVDEAVELAKQGQYAHAAAKIDELKLSPEQKRSQADLFAYAYYRRALLHQHNKMALKAINDLEKARSFPDLAGPLRSLVQRRLTAIQTSRKSPEIQKLDDTIDQYFRRNTFDINLRDKFLRKYGLSQAQRSLQIDHIDAFSCIGVYRWRGDLNHDEKWSQLIRTFKQGDKTTLAFFGRILTEHVQTTSQCAKWLEEIDYIVPVPLPLGEVPREELTS